MNVITHDICIHGLVHCYSSCTIAFKAYKGKGKVVLMLN